MDFVVQPVGELQANAYILFSPNGKDALVVDPGGEPEAVRLALQGRNLVGILVTHGHVDHIGAVADLRAQGAPVYIHAEDAKMLTNPNLSLAAMMGMPGNQGDPDFCLEEGEIELSGIALHVLHTPGHTPGSVCFQWDDCLFSGDTLFKNGMGRTDLPGGNPIALRDSLRRLMTLEPELKVYPGHGEMTTIRDERRYHA